METSALTDLLGATWFGADLSVRTRARLAAVGHLVTFPDGTIVVREGALCEELGVVVHGRIALRLALPGGEDRTILTVEPGDVFGWSAVLPPAIATSTGVAIVPTEVVLFDGATSGRPSRSTASSPRPSISACSSASSAVCCATRVQLLDLYRAGIEPW